MIFRLTIQFGGYVIDNALLCIGVFNGGVIVRYKITLKRKNRTKQKMSNNHKYLK